MKSFFSLFFFFLTASAQAGPAVSSTSGTFNHNSSVTITGSGFGTKAVAAPVIWDNAEHGQSLSVRWTGWVPTEGDASIYMKYDTNNYGLATPHSHGTHYITGKHAGTSPYNGADVELWKNITFSEGATYYVSYYLAVSSDFTPQNSFANYKFFVYNGAAGGPYELPNNWYCSNAYPPSMSQYRLLDDAGGVALNPFKSDFSGPIKETQSTSTWIKYEYLIKLSQSSTGFVKVYADNALIMTYTGRTDNYSGSGRSFGIGGYGDSIGNPRRFFDDVYFDNSFARVILANNANLNNATIIEAQVPSLWNSGSINITVNLGKFNSGQTAYLFVFDSSGAVNASGFPVTIGGGGTAPPPLQAPINLRITP